MSEVIFKSLMRELEIIRDEIFTVAPSICYIKLTKESIEVDIETEGEVSGEK